MLELTNVSKTYTGGVKAVQNASFRVNKGEVLGILGPNGAGKTTTIRMILNIIKPDSGSIFFNGSPVSESVKNYIGYLPEERGLYKKSAIGDVLMYFALLKSSSYGDAKKKISAWLEKFELRDMERRKVEELSKGNQQKVQFIAAMLHEPDLVILDEPFSGLDPINQLKFKDIVLEQRDRGRAIIFCTHQLESAEKICDTIALYNKGQIILQGEVEEVKGRFGSNAVRVEFDGDGSALAHLPMITKSEMYPTSAELQLADNATVNDFLRSALEKVTIHSVQKIQPSLLSIYVDLVGKENLSHDFLKQERTADMGA